MKENTTDDKDRPEWPQGKYCIYKKGPCPEGLTSGWVFWNDDQELDSNKKDGLLPDGDYGESTEIAFCCRTDGDKDDPVPLPSKSPFFLLAYESMKCQKVKGAEASLEWIYYSTSDRNNDDQRNGSYPYNAGKMHPTIYYCYYQAVPTKAQTSEVTSPEDTSLHVLTSKTFTAPKVTLSSTATSITETSKVTFSLVTPATTAKTLMVTSSSSTRSSEMASSSYVISMTLQSPEVTHLSPITPAAHTLIKTTPRVKPWTSTTKLPPKIGCNETLTAVNGTFQSSNYPRNYPDGQYCFWRITVITVQQIYLIFSSFSLQNENNTDVLFVCDGDNATGKAWKMFYGGHPPPKEGICISSNQIFVVFKSDKEGSFHGFSVSYYGVNNSESCAIAASQLSKESGKRNETKQTQRKGLNVVAVIVPVVLAIPLAALVVAGICYIRKRRKRVEGPEDDILLRKRRKRVEGQDDEVLRLISEPTASVGDTEL